MATERLGRDTEVETDADRPEQGELELRRGATVDRYVIVDRIGAGGMGVVYAAYDPDLDRRVAIKLLARASAEGVTRMLREARAAAKVVHPNVIAIHDVGVLGERVFVAMEYVDGITIGRWLARERPDRAAVLAAYEAAGRGLAAAHAAGIVHRDFKPDNVLVGRDGRVRVCDFGLARPLDSSAGEHELGVGVGRSAELDVVLTRTGALLGTPAYMAPEQHLRIACDARADQFSFCVALWEALYGERPFHGDTLAALAARVIDGEIREPPPGLGVPARLRQVLVRGLACDAKDRHPDMDALLDALAHARAARRTPVVLAGVGAGAVALAAAAWWPARAVDPCDPTLSPMAELWSDEAREGLASAFAASGKPWASDSLPAIAGRIDAIAGAWTEQHTDVCRSDAGALDHDTRALLERRRVCLDDRRGELAAALELLGNGVAIERAFAVIDGVRDVATCGDAEALRLRLGPPPAELLLEVHAARGEIARLSARARAGRRAEAEAELPALTARVRAIAWPPLALELETTVLRHIGAPDAPKRLRTAFDQALELGDDLLASELANQLAWEVGHVRRETDVGIAWIATADALRRRVGGDWLLEIAALNNAAVLDVDAGRKSLASAQFTRAIEIARAHDPTGVRPIDLEANLAALLGESGQREAARELFERCAASYRALLGPRHPKLAEAERNLAVWYLQSGELERAAARLEVAMDLVEGSDHEARMNLYLLAKHVAYERGQIDAAVAAARELTRLRAQIYGASDARTIHAQTDLILFMLHQASPPAAEIDAELAAARVAVLACDDDEARLDVREMAVKVARDLGRTPGPDDVAALVAELDATELPPPHTLSAWATLAATRLDADDERGARAALAEADAAADRGAFDYRGARTLFALGQLHTRFDGDADPRARALVDRAAALTLADGAPTSLERDIQAWLADHGPARH